MCGRIGERSKRDTNSGAINAFNAITGAFVGTVRDTSGKVITIDQLWAIDFGDGVPNTNNGPANELFFTAGPDNNLNGTFGSIVFKQRHWLTNNC
jgi:hypothetical protein